VANLTISKKLFLGTGTLVLLTFALGVAAFVSINSLSGYLENIAQSTMRKQALVGSMTADVKELTEVTREIVLRGIVLDQAAEQSSIEQFPVLIQRIETEIEALDAMKITPETQQNLRDMKEALDAIRPAKDSIAAALKGGDVSGAMGILDDTVKPQQKRLEASAQSILITVGKLLAADQKAATSAADTCRWIAGFLLVLTLLAGAVVAFVVRKIDVVLRSSVLELAQSSEQIAAAATQVSSSSQSLAQGSSEQAATIEETSSVSVEINSMAQRNTQNSKQTADIVTDSEAGFHRANDSLSEMVVAMEGISNSSQKISKIIKVIDEIAFQTNILALNAAVEAARAGEAGMGFAVVADEVRSLAQRCAQAAKDTTDLIEDSIQKSDGGMLKVDQVAVAIREITAQSAQIKTLVDEINLGSIEQSRGIDQISTSIGQMEQVTQSSAANAEQTAAAAEELSAQARAMDGA
jgi:methyl-accepting chemotaxis protein/methyl-accepting chemotaxis protein-1 (serine sensor receptor)